MTDITCTFYCPWTFFQSIQNLVVWKQAENVGFLRSHKKYLFYSRNYTSTETPKNIWYSISDFQIDRIIQIVQEQNLKN